MDKEKAQAEYYEKTDFSGLMHSRRGRRKIPRVKRITINISEKVFQEANNLDSYMGMGYQNVLKAAMTLGINELYNKVSARGARRKNKLSKKAA
jgi:predicted DNA binding CopG/RHH family protein